MEKIKTFDEGLSKFKDPPAGWLAEDGYAWYLEKVLGRTPTTEEIKKYGKIKHFTFDK